MEKKAWILVLSGCLALLLLCILGGIAFFLWVIDEPEDIWIDVSVPGEKMKGEEFAIEIQVENSADKEQLLHSIDIYDSYLEGIAIQRTEPKFIQSYHTPVIGMQTYELKRQIPPQTSITVLVFAKGVRKGDFQGDLQVCINSETSCLSYPLRTIVEE